jgi:hypothetical protein
MVRLVETDDPGVRGSTFTFGYRGEILKPTLLGGLGSSLAYSATKYLVGS